MLTPAPFCPEGIVEIIVTTLGMELTVLSGQYVVVIVEVKIRVTPFPSVVVVTTVFVSVDSMDVGET